MEKYQKYLDPKVLNKIKRLDLITRFIVEGFISGLHKSPYHGFSVEFAEHREYVPGDDIRHIDWKVFGKSDRYYIKEYEEETNLMCHIILDTSESMEYKSGEVSKLDYACYVAASLGYLITRQQDTVGLATFDNEVRKFIPPGSSLSHFNLILKELTNTEPRRKTDLGRIFNDLAERIRKRGLVIIISDLFDDPQSMMVGLRHFKHKRHEVIVFHILDEYELEFPFQKMTFFEGLEELPNLLVDPRALRKEYINAFEEYQREVKKGCSENFIDYVLFNTTTPLDAALISYLGKRAATKSKL